MRLVVADAREVLRSAVRQTFEATQGVEVVGEAAAIGELLDVTSLRQPDVVIVNADLLAEGSATSTLEHLASQTSVIVLAATRNPDAPEEAIGAGARAFLSIGCTFDDLIDAVAAVRSGQTVIPSPRHNFVIEDLRAREAGKADEHQRLARLTRRELAVLTLLTEGKNPKAIAHHLVISHQTARTHVKRVLDKLEVHSAVEAAALAFHHGIRASAAENTR